MTRNRRKRARARRSFRRQKKIARVKIFKDPARFKYFPVTAEALITRTKWLNYPSAPCLPRLTPLFPSRALDTPKAPRKKASFAERGWHFNRGRERCPGSFSLLEKKYGHRFQQGGKERSGGRTDDGRWGVTTGRGASNFDGRTDTAGRAVWRSAGSAEMAGSPGCL